MFEFYTRLNPDFTPAFSSSFTFKSGCGLPLVNQVKEVKIGGVPLQKGGPLVKVACNSFLLENIVVKSQKKSHGLINITPKDWRGQALTWEDQGYPREFILLANFLSEKI